MYWLEFDPDVLSYNAPAITVNYFSSCKEKSHTPDFQVVRRQKKKIIEVKSHNSSIVSVAEKIDWRILFKDGLKFELNGKEYQLVELVNLGEWKILNMLTGQHSILAADTIRNFLFEGDLTFTTTKSQQHVAFPDLDETDRYETIRREKYVMAILERGVNKSTAQVLEPIIQDVYDRLQIDEGIDREIKNKPQPSHITVYRWLKKYKQSEGNIHSLVSSSSKKGNRTARIQPEVSSIIQQEIEETYLNPNQASAKDTHDRLIGDR
jgi:putative transposase